MLKPSIDTTPSRVATNALQSIPFSAIIGGPLDAAIKAQALAAQTSWEFIQQVGLQTDENGKKTAVSVTFAYQKDGEMVKIIVPLLAIVPIPYIAIDTITIDFTAKIDASSSTYSEEADSSEASFKGSADIKVGWGIFSAKVHMEGGYSSKKSSKATAESKYSVEYTVNVHVQAGQDSMPAGLAAVLNLLNESIAEAKAGGSFDVSPISTQMDKDQPATITVKSRDGDDRGRTDALVLSYQAGDSNNGPQAIGDFDITVTSGTYDATQAQDKITPPANGITNFSLAVKADKAPATDNAKGKLTVTQGTDSQTVAITIVPSA